MRAIKLPTFHFLSQRRKAMILSATLLGISFVSFIVQGLHFGLDFTGGTVIEVGYKADVDLAKVREALAKGGFHTVIAQQFGTPRDVLLRVPPDGEKNDNQLSQKVLQALDADAPGQVELRRVEYVGPQVGEELVDQSGLAVIFSLIGILIYVAVRFEWRFSVGAIAATIHDAIVTVGFFSVFQIEFDLTVLAAVLTVIGYSLNDTVVVFDRVRENFRLIRKGTTIEIMDQSVNETMSRTIITAGTVLLVVIALYFFGGQTLHGFSIALLLGVAFGTYSTIYVATASALALGVSRTDLLKVTKEDIALDGRP